MPGNDKALHQTETLNKLVLQQVHLPVDVCHWLLHLRMKLQQIWLAVCEPAANTSGSQSTEKATAQVL